MPDPQCPLIFLFHLITRTGPQRLHTNQSQSKIKLTSFRPHRRLWRRGGDSDDKKQSVSPGHVIHSGSLDTNELPTAQGLCLVWDTLQRLTHYHICVQTWYSQWLHVQDPSDTLANSQKLHIQEGTREPGAEQPFEKLAEPEQLTSYRAKVNAKMHSHKLHFNKSEETALH